MCASDHGQQPRPAARRRFEVTAAPDSSIRAARLRIHAEFVADGPELIITPVGDLDLGTAPILRAAFSYVLGGNARVCCDLSQLTFLDAAGLRVLIAAKNLADRKKTEFTIRGARGVPLRIIRVTGLDWAFTILHHHRTWNASTSRPGAWPCPTDNTTLLAFRRTPRVALCSDDTRGQQSGTSDTTARDAAATGRPVGRICRRCSGESGRHSS